MKALSLFAIASCVLVVGCGDAKKPATTSPNAPAASATTAAEDDTNAEKKVWVPNEHKTGKGRWKDSTVYVDGVPRGTLWFAELPPTLAPVWVENLDEIDFVPGDTGPRNRIIKERRYRIVEYLEALGVPTKRVREVHVYGGVRFALRVTRKDLRTHRDHLYFRFGRDTSGKPLFAIDPKSTFNPSTGFDHINAIMVYVDKKPPKIMASAEVSFQGQMYTDVPYFGTPIRGGIRIYRNDRMVARIKRKELEQKDKLAVLVDSELRWNLMDYLESQNVKTSRLKQLEVIFEEARGKRFEGEALRSLYFVASPQKSGEILLGKDRVPANSLALYDSLQPPRPPVPQDAELASR